MRDGPHTHTHTLHAVTALNALSTVRQERHSKNTVCGNPRHRWDLRAFTAQHTECQRKPVLLKYGSCSCTAVTSCISTTSLFPASELEVGRKGTSMAFKLFPISVYNFVMGGNVSI